MKIDVFRWNKYKKRGGFEFSNPPLEFIDYLGLINNYFFSYNRTVDVDRDKVNTLLKFTDCSAILAKNTIVHVQTRC